MLRKRGWGRGHKSESVITVQMATFLPSTPNELSGRCHSTLSCGFSTADTKSSWPTIPLLFLCDEHKVDFECKVQQRLLLMHELAKLH